MPANSETGHAKNVANFKALITTCTYFGAPYNPVNARLKLPALNTLAASADAALNDVNLAQPVFNMRVRERDLLFKTLDALVTRLVNAYAALGADPALLSTVRALARKIKGERASPKPQAATNADGSVTPARTISASQTSFDLRLENFDRLIKALQADPAYQPNEPDLKLPALQTLYASLDAANSAVTNAAVPLENARMARNNVLYGEPGGLVPVAQQVKVYVKSLFGASSAQYKQVNSIRFRRD